MSLRDRPCIIFFPGDYLSATPHFSRADHGGYLLLLWYYYHHGELPVDEKYIQKIARCDNREWPKFRALMATKFDIVNGNWLHKRADKEIALAGKHAKHKRVFSSMQHQTQPIENTEPEIANRPPPSYPTQEGKKEASTNYRAGAGLNGHAAKPSKPRHGQCAPRGRIWFDRGTPEFDAHAADYRQAHFGNEPELNWNGTGAWFYSAGEQS